MQYDNRVNYSGNYFTKFHLAENLYLSCQLSFLLLSIIDWIFIKLVSTRELVANTLLKNGIWNNCNSEYALYTQ